MASQQQWPELLEEEAYLVQIISDTPQDSGALEQTTSTLEVLRADLQSCTSKIATLERDIQDNRSREPSPSSSSSASRFFHRVTESISSTHSHEEKERQQDAQSDTLLEAMTRTRTLRVEIKNLEIKAQVLRRRIRHHEELKDRLKRLYDRIFNGSSPSSPEEDEAEKEVRRAQQILHQAQRTMERHRTLMELLGHAIFAVSTAEPHLFAAISSGDKGVNAMAFQVEVMAAKTCTLQAYIVVDQAKGLDAAFFEQEKECDVFRTRDWMTSVFRIKPTGHKDPQQLTPNPSQQALRSYHTALVSLLSIMRKRGQEHEANLWRAANWHADACGRKQALRRHVLLRYAGVEDDRPMGDTERSRGGLARIREVTAGLEKLISVAAPTMLSAPRGRGGEETKRASTEVERRPPNRDSSSGLSLHIGSPLERHLPLATNSTKQTPIPNLSPETGAQHTPRLSPDDAALRQRQPLPANISLSQSTEARANPQPPPQRLQIQQPSLDGRPEDMRPKAIYGSSRPLSIQSTPISSSGESQAHELRANPQALYDTPLPVRPSRMSIEPPAPSRGLPPQPVILGSSQPGDASRHANPGSSLPEVGQSKSATPTTSPTHRPVGILKSPTAAPPPPPTDLSDPWGVKIATAGPSRSRPKLMSMITKLRGADAAKSKPDPGTRARSASTADQCPPRSPMLHESPKAKNAKLRFSETVVVIPRPAVDSDPYEDEDDDYLPPSPTRGSFLWRTNEQGEEDESEEGGHDQYSQQALAQIDPGPGKREALRAIMTGSSAVSNGQALYAPAPDLHPPRSELHPAVMTPEVHRIAAPRAYPAHSHVPRSLLEARRVSLDDIGGESRRTLTKPEDTRGRFMSPSDSNLMASSQRTLQEHAPVAPPMTRGGVETRSDHDLVQTIFPSPRSTVAEHELLFTH